MRGHIRRRGKASFEYIVDIGIASAQRCQSCNRRFWVERKPKESLSEVRRPACRDRGAPPRDQGRLRHARECQAALNKVLMAVEARTFVAADAHHRQGLSAGRVAAGRQGHAAPDDLRKLHDARHASTSSPVWAACSCRSSTPAAINALYAYLLEEGRVRGRGGLSASSVRRVHAVLHRACHDAVRWGRLTVNPVDAADPPKASAEHTEQAAGLEQPSSSRPSLQVSPTIVSSPSGDCWP